MGRQVANAEMLSALLRYGSSSQIDFLVDNDLDAKALRSLLKSKLPAGKKAFIKHMKSIDDWMPKAECCVIWEPQPPTASLSWIRQRLAPSQLALGGVTHALCSSAAVTAIRQLVASPLRSVDRLVCTSDAVAHTARTLINHWAAVIGKSSDQELIQFETIPLGVDGQRHRPASLQERAEVRQELQIADNADVLLFVGRLSHHAKSNPLPMYAACQRAAARTGRPVTLVMAGWFASDTVKQAFESEAVRVAPLVTLLHVNAMDTKWRDRIWSVADIFVSLADSVQETFGLTVVEAMSRGIPVVASDWNGYRETIQHERTGLLVPTTMVEGAGERALMAMHEDRLSYDHFLAAASQTVCVCTSEACDAIEHLVVSPSLRTQYSEAGIQRSLDFSWEKIIARYERLWSEQNRLMARQESGVPLRSGSARSTASLSVIPSMRDLFERYPSKWIPSNTSLVAGSRLLGGFDDVEKSPLANHSERWRGTKNSVVQVLGDLSKVKTAAMNTAQDHGQGHENSVVDTPELHEHELLDAIAWAMKYDLLKCAVTTTLNEVATPKNVNRDLVEITFSTTCMGRLSHLRETLPRMVAQPGCHVVVVDYSCPEQCGRWVRENYPPQKVTVVNVPDRTYFNMSEAKNTGITNAKTEWVCLIDADVIIADDFAARIRERLVEKRFLRRMTATEGVGGTFVAQRQALIDVGLHDAEFRGWGEEDDDLMDALRFIGHQLGAIPEELLCHLKHDDDLRTKNYEAKDRRLSHLVNRVYRAAKWDLAKIHGRVPSHDERRSLYESIRSQIGMAVAERGTRTITLPLGEQAWDSLSSNAERNLSYKIDIREDF